MVYRIQNLKTLATQSYFLSYYNQLIRLIFLVQYYLWSCERLCIQQYNMISFFRFFHEIKTHATPPSVDGITGIWNPYALNWLSRAEWIYDQIISIHDLIAREIIHEIILNQCKILKIICMPELFLGNQRKSDVERNWKNWFVWSNDFCFETQCWSTSQSGTVQRIFSHQHDDLVTNIKSPTSYCHCSVI